MGGQPVVDFLRSHPGIPEDVQKLVSLETRRYDACGFITEVRDASGVRGYVCDVPGHMHWYGQTYADCADHLRDAHLSIVSRYGRARDIPAAVENRSNPVINPAGGEVSLTAITAFALFGSEAAEAAGIFASGVELTAASFEVGCVLGNTMSAERSGIGILHSYPGLFGIMQEVVDPMAVDRCIAIVGNSRSGKTTIIPCSLARCARLDDLGVSRILVIIYQRGNELQRPALCSYFTEKIGGDVLCFRLCAAAVTPESFLAMDDCEYIPISKLIEVTLAGVVRVSRVCEPVLRGDISQTLVLADMLPGLPVRAGGLRMVAFASVGQEYRGVDFKNGLVSVHAPLPQPEDMGLVCGLLRSGADKRQFVETATMLGRRLEPRRRDFSDQRMQAALEDAALQMTSLKDPEVSMRQLIRDRADGTRAMLLLEVAADFTSDIGEISIFAASPSARDALRKACPASFLGQNVTTGLVGHLLDIGKGDLTEEAFLEKMTSGGLVELLPSNRSHDQRARMSLPFKPFGLAAGAGEPLIVYEFWYNPRARDVRATLRIWKRGADGSLTQLPEGSRIGPVEGSRVVYVPIAGFSCPVVDLIQYGIDGTLDFIQWTVSGSHDVKWKSFSTLLLCFTRKGDEAWNAAFLSAVWRFIFARCGDDDADEAPLPLIVREVDAHLAHDKLKVDGMFAYHDGWCKNSRGCDVVLGVKQRAAIVLDPEYERAMALLRASAAVEA